MTLQGRSALVTGAGRGIGRAIALALSRQGAWVSVNDIDRAAAEAVADEARRNGSEALAIVADVTSSRQVDDMVKKAIDHFGRVDILVNNAGTSILKPFIETDEEDWRQVLSLNLNGVMLCSKAVLGEMIGRNGGRIVNIASIAAQLGSNRMSVYSASKGGVIAFTKSLALEMARHQITVNAVAPGSTDTDLMWRMSTGVERTIKSIPLRRIGRPEDIANAVAFLAGDEASYITGQTLGVNGGWYM